MEQVYLIKRAVIAPVVLVVTIVGLALTSSFWWLVGIPFAILGTLCGQPNLNFVDGCLVWIAILLGAIIAPFHREIGGAIAISSMAGWILGAIEKNVFATPLDEEQLKKYCDSIEDKSIDQRDA